MKPSPCTGPPATFARAIAPSIALGIVLALVALTTPVLANDAATVAGRWEGAVEVPGSKLTMNVDVVETSDGGWAGQIAIPPQNLNDFPLSDVTVDGNQVRFVMKGIPGEPTFDGTVGADGMTGTMTQGGQSMPFMFTRTGPSSYVPTPPITVTDALRDLSGAWTGAIELPQAPNGSLRMLLQVDTAGDVLNARFGSPDQGNTELPVNKMEREGETVRFSVDLIGGSFEGTLDATGNVLDGTLTQGPQVMPLTLTRKNTAE